MSTHHAQLLFVTTVTLSGLVTENLSVLSAQTVEVGAGVGTGVVPQTLQVRGHFSIAPVQALHLNHVSFLLALQNEK
jgi:hypothetical protein